MVVGTLEGDGPQGGLEGFRMASRQARRAPAGAGLGAGLAVGEVGVQTPFYRFRRQLQGVPPDTGFERLEVELVGRLGSYEAGDFGF